MPEVLKIGFYISLALVVIFFWQKKKKKPSKLKLEAYVDQKTKLTGLRKVKAEVVDGPQASRATAESFKQKQQGIFIYKGKKYSAYQVLEVPLGADLKELKAAFAKKKLKDVKNQGLYFMAFEVLKKL